MCDCLTEYRAHINSAAMAPWLLVKHLRLKCNQNPRILRLFSRFTVQSRNAYINEGGWFTSIKTFESLKNKTSGTQWYPRWTRKYNSLKLLILWTLWNHFPLSLDLQCNSSRGYETWTLEATGEYPSATTYIRHRVFSSSDWLLTSTHIMNAKYLSPVMNCFTYAFQDAHC